MNNTPQAPTAPESPDARWALVSGGTGAIGTQICAALARQGLRVVALGHPGEAERLGAWEQDQADGVRAQTLDVTDAQACAQAVDTLVAAQGPCTVLVNAAGITRDATLRKLELEAWREVMATNLDSVYHLSKPVLPGMLEAGHGRIINIASVNGQKGQRGQTNYSAAKAGMHGFTMALAQEVAHKGITVNTVSPGYIDSPMIRRVPEAIREQILSGIPAGRFGNPADVAACVAFLASPAAAYVTGANLPVNGGLFMH